MSFHTDSRFNMGDYSSPYSAADLFGNPYAFDVSARRGQVTNRLAGKVFSVLVLDEFEKAHPVIYQRFLQLFDEGLLVNGNDEVVNLRNAIFILTSNFGARGIEYGRLGFHLGESTEAREKRVLSETEQHFTPEFINRMDAVCVFHPLTRAVMADIARREIGDLLQRDGITRRQFDVDIADEVIEHVVAQGYSPHYGARYLKRHIEKTVTYPLAREINARPPGAAGGSIRLYLKRGRITSAFLPLAEAQAAPLVAEPGLPAPVTLAEIVAALPVLTARVEALEELHRLAAAIAERDTILAEMGDVGFWNDRETAQRKLDDYQRASSTADMLGSLRRALDRLSEGCAAETPALQIVMRPYKFLLSELPRIEFTSWLSGPHDAAGAYIQIGIKSRLASARQWAAELARMYLGWARQRRLTAAVLGEDLSPEGRATTLTLAVSGFSVYGLLRAETGVHRLVQKVKTGDRETTQRLPASVLVLPELGDEEVPSAPGDLEIKVKEINRSGLLLPRLTAQVTAWHAASERRLSLAGNLPPDDLAAEAARILRTSFYVESGPPDERPALGELVRSYLRGTRDKGVHDHRTHHRTVKLKQLLEGDLLQEFLDEALRQRSRVS